MGSDYWFSLRDLSVPTFAVSGELSLKSWMSMALTALTKKPASFSAGAMGRQCIPVCSMTTQQNRFGNSLRLLQPLPHTAVSIGFIAFFLLLTNQAGQIHIVCLLIQPFHILDMMMPPDVVLLFSYIRGLLSIVRFYWGGSIKRSGAVIFITIPQP